MINEFDRYFRVTNRKIFNKKYKKDGRVYNCIPVTERVNSYEPYHIHALVDMPNRVCESEFKQILRENWPHSRVDLRADAQGEFVKYICKLKSKELDKSPFVDSLIVSSLALDNKIVE